MNTREILSAIHKLPVPEQKRIYESLAQTLKPDAANETERLENEVERQLLAKGVISRIPPRLPDAEEEEYEPIAVVGKSLSETIIEERR